MLSDILDVFCYYLGFMGFMLMLVIISHAIAFMIAGIVIAGDPFTGLRNFYYITYGIRI